MRIAQQAQKSRVSHVRNSPIRQACKTARNLCAMLGNFVKRSLCVRPSLIWKRSRVSSPVYSQKVSFSRSATCAESTEDSKTIEGRGIVLGVYSTDNGPKMTESATQFDSLSGHKLSNLIQRFCPNLKKGEVRVFYDPDSQHVAQAVVGLGRADTAKEDISEDRVMSKQNIRIASAAGVKALKSAGLRSVEVEDFGDLCAAAEGSFLAGFVYDEFKSKKSTPLNISPWQGESDDWNRGKVLADGQNFARYLMESPSNVLTPQRFVQLASQKMQENTNSDKVVISPRNKDWLEEQKMNAFLAVSQGSSVPPVLFEASYRGTEREGMDVVLVGKGVTFDTGGISIKPSAGMDLMRGDMGGAACVVGALWAAATLALPLNLTVLAPLCENMPSGSAVKPGDVVVAMNGKSIQVDNTDAEGRLILGDALHYAHSFNPTSSIVDLATLTGAVDVALGSGAAGMFTHSQHLCDQLHKSGQISGDRLWRMPLFEVYSDQIQAKLADVNNVSTKSARSAGACTAAAFLSHFVTTDHWAHLDIAGVMSDGNTGMTGRPTRTIVEYLHRVSKGE